MSENKDLVSNPQVINNYYEKLIKTVIDCDINDFKKIQIMKLIINKYNNQINKGKHKDNTNSCALLVGINYFDSQYRLYGCINDVNCVKSLLQKKNFKKITLLTDDNVNKGMPTKDTIINELIHLLTNAKPGETLFFQYSGHGSDCPDRNNDELRGYDQTIIPSDFNAITDDDIRKIIDKYLKQNVTLVGIMDCCYSGSSWDLKFQYLDSFNKDKLTINKKVKDTRGKVFMISGCTDAQTSADAYINGNYNGALTYAFLDSYNKLQLKQLTWKNLLSSMRTYLKSNGYPQIPQLSSGKFLDINSRFPF